MPEWNFIIRARESSQESALSLLLLLFQNRSSELSLLNKKYFSNSRKRKGETPQSRGSHVWVQEAQVGPRSWLGLPSIYSPSFCLPLECSLPITFAFLSFLKPYPPHTPSATQPPNCVLVGTTNPHLFLYSRDLPLLPRTCSSSSSLRLAF